MDRETTGTVISVSKQWWLKVNTKPVRLHALDGATFPYIIKVSYTADGIEYTRRKWIRAGQHGYKRVRMIAVNPQRSYTFFYCYQRKYGGGEKYLHDIIKIKKEMSTLFQIVNLQLLRFLCRGMI